MNRKFRLASVKTVRTRQRDKAAAEVAEIHRAIEIFQQQMDEVRFEIASLINERKTQSTGSLHVSELLDSQRYEMQLGLQLQAMGEKMQILESEKAKREAKLLLAQQNLKSIELLEEKHWQDLQAFDARALQSRLDEWTTTKVGREKG